MLNRFVLIVFVLFLFEAYAYSQESKIHYYSGYQTVGYNYSSEQQILAKSHTIPGEIVSIYELSEKGNYACFIKGTKSSSSSAMAKEFIMIYNFLQDTCIMIKEYSFSSISDYCLVNDNLNYRLNRKYYSKNLYTWKNNWKLNAPVIAVGKEKKLGLSYICETFSSEIHSLKGVSLETGKTTWVKPVRSSWLIRDIIENDSVVFLLTDEFLGAYSFDNGEVWNTPIDIKIIKGYSYTAEDAAISALGVLTGVFTGFYFVSLGTPEQILLSGSNLFFSSNTIFYADANSVKAIDTESGKIKWEYLLTEDFVGMSKILEYDEKIILINYGFSKSGRKIFRNSKSSLIFIDKNNGDLIKELKIEHLGKYVVETIVREGVIYIKTDSHFLTVSLSENEILSSKTILETKAYNKFINKTRLYYYSLSENTFSCLKEGVVLIESDNAFTYFCDSFLNVQDSILSADLFEPVYVDYDWMFFQYADDIYVTDLSGDVIMRFANVDFQIFINNRLYFTNNRKMFFVEIK
jgi:outer membrane protein assembly factor BamB